MTRKGRTINCELVSAISLAPLYNVLTNYSNWSSKHNCGSLLAFIDLLLSFVKTILHQTSMVASSLFQWIDSLCEDRKQPQKRRRSSSRRSHNGIPESVLSTIDEDKQVLVFEDDYDFEYNRKSSEMGHFILVTLLVVLSMALAARIGTLTGATFPEKINRSNSSRYIHSYRQLQSIETDDNHDDTHNKNSIGISIGEQVVIATATAAVGIGEQVEIEIVTAASASALRVEDENAVPSRTEILPLTNNNKDQTPSRQSPHSLDDITNAFMAKKMEEGLRRRASPRRR